LRASAKLGIYELQTGGTTTLLDMGTMNHQRVVFDELNKSGMRAFAGKCMIDENDLLAPFKESTKASLEESYQLAKEFHNSSNGRIKYAFAPRFVLSCSEELLIETSNMQKDFEGALYHTHSSENKGEIEAVRAKTGMENIEYFDSIGILGNRTILAHGIHVNEKEIEILKNTATRISHCPSANLKLASGTANIPRYLDEGISVSLGADGPPCNNNLSMFTEMRLASLIQKPLHGPTVMDAKTVFRLATIEGAKALGIENEVGSIEVGKKADLVTLDLDNPEQPLLVDENNIYSAIIYSSSPRHVKSVFIDGRQVVENGESLVYDKDEIFAKGKEELRDLLKRAETL
jgi:5-methylthioadenosine/S-adenosylhomocysteine deaminase